MNFDDIFFERPQETMRPQESPQETIRPQETMRPVVQEVEPSGSLDSKYMNALGQGPEYNVSSNIIAGHDPKMYWNHSPGLMRPEMREEGPFPVQGNIGALMKQEAINQYASCSPDVDDSEVPNIGSSPNCTGVFDEDLYTKSNTCGAECVMKYPESFGLKDFGFPENMPWNLKVTNAHQLHAYQNVRAGMPGQGPANDIGCYEWVPRVSPDQSLNSCVLNQEPAYEQVPSWNKLPMYNNIQKIKWAI